MTNADPNTGPGRGGLARWEIGALVCRGIALYFLVQAVMACAGLFCSLVGLLVVSRLPAGQVAGYALGLAGPLTQIVLSVGLWCLARVVGRRMALGEPGAPAGAGVDARSLLQIAFATVGLCLAVVNLQGLAQLALQVDLIRRQSGSPSARFWDDATTQSHFWGQVIGLAMGIWLLFGSRWLVRVLDGHRHGEAGSSEPQSPAAS